MTKSFYLFTAALCIFSACCNDGCTDTHLPKADNYGALDEAVQLYLQDLRDLGSTNELNSIMVLKDGKILQEYYDCCYGPDFLNICWSASKTFTATAVGFAVQDGLIGIHDKLVSFLDADMLPEHVSDTLAGLEIYDLLRMSSGLEKDFIAATGSLKLKTPTKTVLESGFAFAPGEKYRYNSMNTYLLSVAVTKATGKLVHEYLQEKLFDKMGIHNYHWDISAEGYDMGGWGLYITTESLAKMGQFFLQKGRWNGEQVLDSAWIEEAANAQIYQTGNKNEDNDWENGYGYQMWISTHNAARIDGAHGQWVLICPDKNVVIVITQNVNKTREMIKSVWTRIYDRI